MRSTPPSSERRDLLLVGVAQVRVADLTEGRELGAGTDAAGHPARTLRSGEVGDRGTCQPGGGEIELTDPVGLAVLGEHRGERAEGVGLDDVATHLEERPVDPLDHVGPSDDEELVAPFELGAAEVVGTEIGQLQVGPHGAVEDHDALGRRLSVARALSIGCHGRSRVSGSARGPGTAGADGVRRLASLW